MRRAQQLLCIIFKKVGKDYEYLLLRRTAERGGFWQPVSGGLEDSDASQLKGAYREIDEEAGDLEKLKEKIKAYPLSRC